MSNSTNIEDNKKYNEKIFGSSSIDTNTRKRHERAFEYAVKNRDFEIELYWKRANYFWIFIGAMLVALFAILAVEGYLPPVSSPQTNSSSTNPIINLFAFTIACSGFFLTFSWFLANKGSKFWQENWEGHIDFLEQGHMGDLYKTILLKKPKKNWRIIRKIKICLKILIKKTNLRTSCKFFEKFFNEISLTITESAPYSVSRINQFIGAFILFFWFFIILILFFYHCLPYYKCWGFIFLLGTVFFSFAVCKYGKNRYILEEKTHKLQTNQRKVTL